MILRLSSSSIHVFQSLDHHFSLCLGAWRFRSLALTFAGYGWLCSCDLHCHAEATSGVCLICFFFFCDDPLGGKYSRYYGEWRCLGWSCIFLFPMCLFHHVCSRFPCSHFPTHVGQGGYNMAPPLHGPRSMEFFNLHHHWCTPCNVV